MRRTNPFVPYLFVLPLVALLVFVFGLSLVRLVEFSFKQVRGIDGPWIGLRNYELVLGQSLFWESGRWLFSFTSACRAGASTARSSSCPTSSRSRSSRL